MFRICSLFALIFWAFPLLAVPVEITGTARVIDGDTLEVSGQRIRLGGIDAPEMSETCVDARGKRWDCGVWATEATRAILAQRTVRCVDLGERSYQRVVGRCYLDGRDLAVTLIEAGAARPCLRFARAQGSEAAYLAAERVAIAAEAGVYRGPLNPAAGFCNIDQPARDRVQVSDAPGGCVIKGNVSANGRIYHMPGQRDYDRVTMRNPETRWFCSEAEARAAGWRRAQR
ncbi:MAG: thermonuclease family protein [Rhodobacteraceae bacterium]|nr:MAG: thermonuclease family protein [Paracoccaceae bacterium]